MSSISASKNFAGYVLFYIQKINNIPLCQKSAIDQLRPYWPTSYFSWQ